MVKAEQVSTRVLLFVLVSLAGTAALSWETLWQMHASLALGISSYGTAITLAATLGGMSCGALLAGRLLRQRQVSRPLILYGVLELTIGLSGILLPYLFGAVAGVDAAAYRAVPALAPLIHLLGIVLVLGIPTLAMGATLPLFGLIARQVGTSISLFYGLNTLGAAAGTLLVALFGIPHFGATGTGFLVAGINFVVGVGALAIHPKLSRTRAPGAAVVPEASAIRVVPAWTWAAVFITGLATFALEVTWFRSLRAGFHSTTDAFAVMLASVLLALGVAARLAPRLRQKFSSPAPFLALAGIWIIAITPLIERFDTINFHIMRPVLLSWFAMTFIAVGPAMLLLGVVLPWLLDEQENPRQWAQLYALNTAGAILGALLAAWVLLPWLGFVHTAWAMGVVVFALSALRLPGVQRAWLSAGAVAALAIAVGFDSGVGRDRIQGQLASPSYTILRYDEGPDVTVAAVELQDGQRSLVIDGFQAASEMRLNHYMEWMGRLPMLLHPDPRDALVICFGTGQTANGVRQEGAASVDIVDLNRAVFAMADLFLSNQAVLSDSRVQPIVMDGRAFLRRSQDSYDVITLEPMPPNFAGVNALYSWEFYVEARARLRNDGIVAQWVPFHLISPVVSASIVATMESVFPGSFLWLDPVTPTGILIGRKGGSAVLPSGEWPGLARTGIARDLTPEQIEQGVLLHGEDLLHYAAHGQVITDDNQFLAYGREAMALWRYGYNLLIPNMKALSMYTGRRLPLER